jgi:hypothetical protein
MKKIFLLSLITLALTSKTFAQETPPTTNAAPIDKNAPVMKFEALEYNYGKIKQGEVVTKEFKFKNVGKSPLIISSAQGSCGCTVPEWPKDPIKPKGTGTIKVTFNSTHKSGLQDKTVTIKSNGKEETVVLHIKGEVLLEGVEPAKPQPEKK